MDGDDNNNPTIVSSRPGVQRRQRLLGIPVDLLVVSAVCLLVGALVGRALARKKLIRDLLSGRVAKVENVKGMLNDDQRQMLHDLIDSGAEVLQQKIGNTVLLLVKAGGDSFSRLFVVPSLDGDRTLADLDREQQRAENGAVIEVA
ncbi:MAG: hypothetical protein EBZ75_13485 [Oxalobacteraceae bacterium]|nr:hypothetical protein [Oxalobacteraceae bacterium]